MQQQSSIEVPASILVRRVRRRPVDYAELIEVDRLVQDLLDGTDHPWTRPGIGSLPSTPRTTGGPDGS